MKAAESVMSLVRVNSITSNDSIYVIKGIDVITCKPYQIPINKAIYPEGMELKKTYVITHKECIAGETEFRHTNNLGDTEIVKHNVDHNEFVDIVLADRVDVKLMCTYANMDKELMLELIDDLGL